LANIDASPTRKRIHGGFNGGFIGGSHKVAHEAMKREKEAFFAQTFWPETFHSRKNGALCSGGGGGGGGGGHGDADGRSGPIA
jgi:hypothetical protein